MKNFNHIFVVGIKGVGMANIAILLKQMGKHVSGSDTAESFDTDERLQRNGINVITSFSKDNLPADADLLIYSAANGGSTNPQVVEAKKKGIKVLTQAEFIEVLIGEFEVSIAVCGTHGKTNTASLLTFLLQKLNANPSYIIGAASFNDVDGGGYHGKKYFVFEADEYGVDPPRDLTPKLNIFTPKYAICTSIDFDHPDVYKNVEEVKQTFLTFFKKIIAREGKVFLCADDGNITELMKQLPQDSIVPFGFSHYSHYMVSNVMAVDDVTLFDVTNNTVSVGSFSTKLFGDKLVGNVTGVIAVLLNLGFSADDIHDYLPEFTGAKRRFEHVATENGVDIYDDYGHHPAEILATYETARAKFGNRRLIVIFQPHTFSRTESLKNEFIEALSKFDRAYIAPIFSSAREDSSKFNVTSKTLEDIAVKKKIKNVQAYLTKDELMKLLKKNLKHGDVVITLGAGDIYKIKNDIIKTLYG